MSSRIGRTAVDIGKRAIRRFGGRLNLISPDELRRSLPNLLGHDRRRVWMSEQRAHVEMRDLTPDQMLEVSEELQRLVASDDGISVLDVNALTGRVVFRFPPGGRGWLHFERLVGTAEENCGYGEVPFPTHRPKYPSDVEPIVRELLELSLDTVSVGVATSLKLAGYKPSSLAFDLTALTSLTENTPRVRQWLEKKLGTAPVNVGLGSASAFFHSLSAGPIGPALDSALRLVRVRGELARREVWEVREAELFRTGDPAHVYDFECPERPRELPTGNIEHYADASFMASMGGFAVGLLDTEDLEASFGPLFGGLPKAARYGREAFIGELTRILAERNIIAMRPNALAAIDRVDTILVEDRVLIDANGAVTTAAKRFASAVRAAGMTLVVASSDEDIARRVKADEWVPITAESWRSNILFEAVVQHQREGGVVAAVAATACRAHLAADLGIGICLDAEPPWQADLIATDQIHDATFVVEACMAAQDLASESVVLAGVGAIVGSLAAVGRGLKATDPGRVMLAVNITSLVALTNGMRRARELDRKADGMDSDAPAWHSMSIEEVLSRVDSSESGLPEDQVKARREVHEAAPTGLSLFARSIGLELMNPFTPILTAGAALAAMVGSAADAAIVGSAVVLNAAVSGGERYQAERAVAHLEKYERDSVTVFRDGAQSRIDPDELVVGDVLAFEAGDEVPADCRILDSSSLEIDESMLTGESLPVSKSTAPCEAKDVAERSSMLYASTSISSGSARAVVVALGDETESQRAAHLVRRHDRADGVEARLREIAGMTLPVAGYSSAVLASAGLLRDEKITRIVSTGVGLAVASVPEGLPLLATLSQLAAARRLADRGVIVRNPRTIETLGRVDILCADKTGTLTEGTLRLHGVANRNGDLVIDEAIDADWAREILLWARRASPVRYKDDPLPHATDEAIVAGAESAELGGASDTKWTRSEELPFCSNRGYHAVLGRVGRKALVAAKGAPEVILPRCSRLRLHGKSRPLSERQVSKILAAADDLAGDGLRVLCVARGPGEGFTDGSGSDDVSDLTFLGFVLLSDPIRGSSAEAVRRLRAVGIDTMMITGDHPKTAIRIAVEAGILLDEEAQQEDVYITGRQVDEMGDDELEAALEKARVVARATPAQKVRIVAGLQRLGRCVAMTGDGGNDASAIRLADVGIALGSSSTKAARSAADMIVVDPHLETIVEGIAEGRAMWPALRDAVSVLIGGNLGEIGFTVASGVIGQHAALNARQLLLINLLTDIAPAMAIALTPPSEEVLAELLGERPEDALGARLDRDIIMRAICTGGGGSAAYLASRWLPRGRECAPTVALLALVGSQLGQTLSAGHRSRQTKIAAWASAALMLGIIETPGLSHAFGCRPVGPVGLSIAAGGSVLATIASKAGPRALERVSTWLEEKVEELDAAENAEGPRSVDSDFNIGFPFGNEDQFAFG